MRTKKMTVGIKDEKVAVKVEVSDTDVQNLQLDPQGTERFSKEEVTWKGIGDGTNDDKTVKEEPARTPSGVIPRYSGSESRGPDRPGFGWSWSHSREAEFFQGQQPVGGVTNSKMTDAYRSLYDVGIGKSVGTAGPPNNRLQSRASSGSAELFNTSRTGQATGNLSRLPGNSLSNLPPIALSNTVAHMVKSLPQFFSDSATVEKTRLFWNAFETNTEVLPDQSRLLVFRQKLKGRETERWWGNSSIRDFKTLKLQFHNHFLSRTADELWERLQTTKESEESLLRNGVILCDSLDYPDARMRYQLFCCGLRNKRCLATLDSDPACDIPEAPEWLMFKDMHHPIEEDDELAGDAKALNSVASNQAAIDALSLKMDAILQAQSQQPTRNGFYQPRPPRNRSSRVDAVVNSGALPLGMDSLAVVGYRLEESVWEPISAPTTESLSAGDATFSDVLAKHAGASA
ncbi:hypothetical protein PHMEG_00020202 [Phytophthora megakarya]|uniref:Uncharacterized protein n=1 Tax=Phytophthora megakarya TaxID=4795 RepID=A0A225VQV8_9STRA|nr:hypothetical protein PHMEG_00020202 [Phytophthora megakarya]